jgi:ABC-type polar amino acid transport system ATPase subunit
VIVAESIEKAFSGTKVLAGASIRVEEGELAALIGPSGSGKSTLLRCLNGLETFDAGKVEVGGIAVPARAHPRRHADLLATLRRQVGMVFQGFHLFPHLDVLENLVLAPTLVLGEATEEAALRATEMLRRVGLESKTHARPGELSGGQQQRVAIARALLMRPKALLFDEPTSALDPRASADVLALMTELASGGLTMIVVTHALGFARRAARTVHVLSEGRVVESGAPASVLERPEHEVTQGLIAAERGA